MNYVADIATQLQRGAARIATTMRRVRTTPRKGGFGSLRAPLGTDAFNVEFVLQAAACIDWSALAPWMDAVDTKLGATLPSSIYKLHVLAVWFELDGPALERACMQRAEFRRFIAAPLHGPIVDAQLYREYEPGLQRARQALYKLVAAVELQLVDHGFFSPTEVLGSLDLSAPAGRETVPTLALPRAPRAVALGKSEADAAAPDRRPGPTSPTAAPAPARQAMLIWPWGEISMIDHRIRIGRDDGYSEHAKHLGADLKVSRRHAVIEPTDDGVLLQDLGSVNGTYVDDEALRHSGTRLLTEDAVIKFGTELAVMLVFVAGERTTDRACTSSMPRHP